MFRKATYFASIGFLCLGIVFAQAKSQDGNQHEWTQLRTVNLADSTEIISTTLKQLQYPKLNSKDSILVSGYIAKHPVTLIWYFASWCWNCNQEAPILHKLYQKYHSQGFQVLGVGVYSPRKKLAQFRKKYDLQFPIVVGPSTVKKKSTRQMTYHYQFRKAVGDQRTWGTPFSILVLNGKFSPIYVASGEFTERDLTVFLENNLQ